MVFMTKRPLIFVLALSLLVVGAGVWVILQRDQSGSVSDIPSTVTQETVNETINDNETTGEYIEYSSSAIAETTGEKVLFFHAPWCPQCRSIEAGIISQGVPDGLTIIKVDYDSNQLLRQKYGVTLQTTFVRVDDEGNLIDKYTAYREPTFDAVKRDYLEL